MNRNIISVLFLFLFLFCSSASADDNEPIVLLTQITGKVAYASERESWKFISRNKFLYEGDRIKTDDTGRCKLIYREKDILQPVETNTEILISKDRITVLKGTLPEAESSDDIMGFLKRKFAKVQKYTAVKRKGKIIENNYLQIAPDITLSEAYPEIVWENLGADYSYELIINGKTYNISETKGYMVSFKLTDMSPGVFDYYVNVFYKGELLYIPKEKGTLRWLSVPESNLFQKKVARINQIDSENGFLMGNIMDEHGLKVAAMYEFQKFLFENPDINETRPFLIKIYDDLKLNKIKENEIKLYRHNRGIGN